MNNIELIIKQRLNLQSTIRSFEEAYGLTKEDILMRPNKLKSKYLSLDELGQKQFSKLLVGYTNMWDGRRYIENL